MSAPREPLDSVDALALLHAITRELLSSESEVQPMLDAVVERIGAWSVPGRVMVTIMEPGCARARVEASHGLSPAERRRGRYRVGEGVIGRVLDSGDSVLVPSIGADPGFLDRTLSRRNLDRERIAFLCVPIRDRGEVIGTLSVDRDEQRAEVLREDLRLVEIVAQLIGRAVGQRRDHLEELESLRREHAALGNASASDVRPAHTVGSSREMRTVFEQAAQVAPTETTVLLRGESGTGKELVARAIHEASKRSGGPFVAVNCGSLPSQLVESELFGHVKGAFTGAGAVRRGRFEMADGGTLFLDELGELEVSHQTHLLRVLQDGMIYRVGDERPRSVNVRVIAATNVNLEEAMSAGRFREDLFYRLSVFPIFLPPLRERKGDIVALADHFLEKFAEEHGKEVLRLSTPAIDLMTAYHWPGNVRELENCIARAVLVCDEGVVRAHHLPPSLQTGRSSGTSQGGALEDRMMDYEREILVEAMRDAGGNQARASRALSTTPRILGYRLRRHGLLEELAQRRG